MTNAHLLEVFKANIGTSLLAALRGVWNAGYYEAKGVVPTASSPDKSMDAAKPTAVLTNTRKV